jgi:NADH dehydrogenase
MFGRGIMRLQPVYVEDVAAAIARVMCRAETPSTIFELGGPRVYSYAQLLGAIGHEAGLDPLLIPIPIAVWHALASVSEMLPHPPLTRNQVELLQIDTVSSQEVPGFAELGISPHSVEAILQTMLPTSG